MTLTVDDLARMSGATDGLYKKMSEDSVPRERYYTQAFADLEREKLWTRTWQPACRLEEIPKVGDYSEYNIVDQSFLVVRASETEIKAYSNHCRHRGNELGNGNGSYRSGKIVCSFHGWRWNLDGSNDKVFASEGFTPACLDPERLRLVDIKVAIAWGMVWINPDPEAAPFEEHLSEILNATCRDQARGHEGPLVALHDRRRELEDGPRAVHGGLPRGPDASRDRERDQPG